MNTAQKTVLVLGIVAFCLSVLFVSPAEEMGMVYGNFFSYKRHYPIFSKIVLLKGVDMGSLLLKWVFIGSLVGAGMYLAGRKKGEGE